MKLLYIICGFICIGLGAIGAVLPGLPTTPFLLLALFCFTKGSEKMHLWFIQTKLYKKYLQEYDEKRAMTMKQKITILAISFPFTLFAFLTLPHIGGKIAVAVLVIIQYWYFFCKMKTLPAEPIKP
ncbi:UDP-N-acetylenolpyruvoylglucosamine reductase [Mannheimia sp. USDA-ARS-USMARC-1261]|uniref:YbaN family protein n=1 Tax=Mannheimia TaxID=75984 RepID=UPI0003E33ED0|nr:YbaN family protein [Mannheimia sp. USDA-ARS-USMARC-1261]AHG74337.1 UDP-N-acetylenolpyruvoylglucosamine reductase [Mannheimia sp. USDA-ARS-USMARC-1261]